MSKVIDEMRVTDRDAFHCGSVEKAKKQAFFSEIAKQIIKSGSSKALQEHNNEMQDKHEEKRIKRQIAVEQAARDNPSVAKREFNTDEMLDNQRKNWSRLGKNK